MTKPEPNADETTRQLIRQLADVMGGGRRLAQVEAVRCSGTLRLISTSPIHICGYWECAWTATGHYRATVSLAGDIRHGTVFDCSTRKGWVLAADDSVTRLPEESAQELLGRLYLLTCAWLVPDRISGRAQATGESPSQELEMLPADGFRCTVQCNPTTGLPEELTWAAPSPSLNLHPHLATARLGMESTASAAEQQTTRLRDWSEVDGFRVPRQVVATAPGAPKYVYRPEKLEINPRLPGDFFAKPAPPPPDVRFPAGARSVTFPFQLVESRMVVSVHVNGRGPFPFLLDTGTSTSLVDDGLARRLALPLKCRFRGDLGGGSEVTTVNLAEGVTFQLEGLESRTHDIMVMPIDQRTETSAGIQVLGILGGSFIRRFVVDIDYEKTLATLFRPNQPPDSPDESLPIQTGSGVPMVKASLRLPGKSLEATLMMDSGADWPLLLNRPFVEEHGLFAAVSPSIETVTFGMGGEAPLTLGRISELKLGKLSISNPIVALSRESKGTLGESSFSGILGAEVLRRLHLRLDYGRGSVSFAPNPRFGSPFEADMSGMVLQAAPDGESFRIAFVVARSPAAQAGLLPQDRIVAISARPTAEWSFPEFARLRREPGREFQLDVQRDGKTFATKIQTRQLI